MNTGTSFLLVCTLAMMTWMASRSATAEPWTIYVTNDNCPDYTWGYTERQTRQAFADIVRGHLDVMAKTDKLAPADRGRYNMAVTLEAICFVERYPKRKDELIRRLREGRLYLSPFLCNSLWGFQGFEGNVRSLMPARRLERRWGISIDVAEHIEQPSLPWGMATILAGCGVRWLSVPYYGHDSTFGRLKTPPLFVYTGPDGAKVRVVMDRWACNRATYAQGRRLLRDPRNQVPQCVDHYRRLGQAYPLRAILASGTHGDISPHSGGQARGFAEAIRKYNARGDRAAKLVNAALPQFCAAVDAAQKKQPFLPAVRGSFGHSWDLWPVCLAKYAARMREGGRRLLTAESLLALAAASRPKLVEAAEADRHKAEWCWAMLSDHAWNGTGRSNKRHNADLRRRWSADLNRLADKLLQQAWSGLGPAGSDRHATVFNPLSIPRRGLVRLAAPKGPVTVACAGKTRPSQVVEEDGRRVLYFVTPKVAGFGVIEAELRPGKRPEAPAKLQAKPTELAGPFYRLKVDPKTGGIRSLIHAAGGVELATGAGKRTLCQTVYFDGKEHTLTDVRTEVLACGPVLARLGITGTAAGIRVTNRVTIYAELDRVDFDLRIHKPTSTTKQRLCQAFPVLPDGATLRIETPGAVIRPRPQPRGDLLTGADTRRFAVQGFVDASKPKGPGVTIAPLDAFALRLDLAPIAFEALGNDQNYREVVQDQHRETDFRFRYALRGHAGGYDQAQAIVWSRCAARPMVAVMGRPQKHTTAPAVTVDPARAVVTAFKPGDEGPAGSCALRLWEVAGRSGPLSLGLKGFRRATLTDLLERPVKDLPIKQGKATIDLRRYGFAAVRLIP